jgi:hypothetical protein
MLSFGDGASTVDFNSLPIDPEVTSDVALEIAIDNPNVGDQAGDIQGWKIVFRGPNNVGGAIDCEGGAFTSVTRTAEESWTIDTSASSMACVYETFRTGKGKKTTTELRGRIDFPITIELSSAP